MLSVVNVTPSAQGYGKALAGEFTARAGESFAYR